MSAKGEQNPDELIMLFENMCKRAYVHTNTPHDHTQANELHSTKTHAQTRAETANVPDTDLLCPVPLWFQTSSFQQALIFSLSLSSVLMLSLKLPPTICHHSEKQNVKNTLASKH